ncbi:DUF364 domain-containing protein [Desulfosarcina cetonica]|uniref:DUF364 domain-containing protein n=1 Tax=Desulfosarcina cetonica TaxID=90730 RepID=UPI001BCF1103|nr:DUF364 domain-containing protein [Desulfosarcina cetonica]
MKPSHDFPPTDNEILMETVTRLRSILGRDMDRLTVERTVVGIFFSGVKLSNGDGGICFTPIKEIPEAVCCPSSARAMPNAGRLDGQTVKAYLERMNRGGPLHKALGIAVLNALSATCWRGQIPIAYNLLSGADPVDNHPIPDDAVVVVIGALVPYIRMLKQRGRPFHILEKDPRTLKADEMPFFTPPEKAHACIAAADLIIITGTTLINATLEGILAQKSPHAEAILVGPTASMLPEAFFKRGIQAIGGITVTKPDLLLDTLSQGGSGYHFYGRSAERLVIAQSTAPVSMPLMAASGGQ